MDWRERLRLDSEECLADLVSANSEFSVDAEQPSYRGGTHDVTFGRYRGDPAVYKYFVAARRWENEAACLTHFAGSGLVPRVFYQRPGTLIVMERLPGTDVLNALSSHSWNSYERDALSREVGIAFGRLTSTPLPNVDGYNPLTDFPDWGWRLGLPEVVGRCLRDGRKILEAVESSCSETLASSLALIEERSAAVAGEPPILFHEDASNLRVASGRFVGFYDLELCRGGTASMQLGAALNLCGEGRLDWNRLIAGFEEAAPRLTKVGSRAILAMNHLSRWIRLCEPLRVSQTRDGLKNSAAEAVVLADSLLATAQILKISA